LPVRPHARVPQRRTAHDGRREPAPRVSDSGDGARQTTGRHPRPIDSPTMTTTGTSDGARRRTGVMGGTFDPIHHGHLVAASEVAHRFGLDDVVFVPTGEPWQKRGRAVSPAEDRYLMTVIATASNPRFSVSRVDIDRDGP